MVIITAAICYLFSDIIGYKTVALILLTTVSITAMFFELVPVLITATISAIIWDVFFIPPRFTFIINSSEDLLMFLMYFIIALVNASLTYKIRQIEKQNRDKEEKENTLNLYNTILNSLSHELRTPIATIIGATDNLVSNNNLTESNKNDLIHEVSKASFKLNYHVENLLNMSRIESGHIKIKLDWCDMSELVYKVLDQLKEQSAYHKIQVNIQSDLSLVKIDYGLMEQVLYNLISNAISYTKNNTEIDIAIKCDTKRLIIIIQDNGNGFPENEIDHVFDKFYRLKQTNTGGTGLGLSIVKGFIEAHCGEINLENRNEGGAKFTIQIPTETMSLNHLKNE